MKSPLYMLAFDINAGSGRCVLGSFDGRRLETGVMGRFGNAGIRLCETKYWDILTLVSQMQKGLTAFKKAVGGQLASFSVDGWGADFGLVDRAGKLIGIPYCFKENSAQDIKAVYERISKSGLFLRTGSASVYGSVFRLARLARERDTALENADSLLFISDLLSFFFTGERWCEYTCATTSSLFNHAQRGFDGELLAALRIPGRIFLEPHRPGERSSQMMRCMSEQLGISPLCISGISHDTAAAEYAVALPEDCAFLGGGTWSLFGYKSNKPVTTLAAYDAGITNEGTADGGSMVMLALSGRRQLSLALREWRCEGEEYSEKQLEDAVLDVEPFSFIVDFEQRDFYEPGPVCKKIESYCARTGQNIPRTKGEIARCIFDGIALQSRTALSRLEEIRGKKFKSLCVTGGCAGNPLLCELIASAAGIPVTVGPENTAAAGNLLSQLKSLQNLTEREILDINLNSFPRQIYEPKKRERAERAYEKLFDFSSKKELLKTKV